MQNFPAYHSKKINKNTVRGPMKSIPFKNNGRHKQYPGKISYRNNQIFWWKSINVLKDKQVVMHMNCEILLSDKEKWNWRVTEWN